MMGKQMEKGSIVPPHPLDDEEIVNKLETAIRGFIKKYSVWEVYLNKMLYEDKCFNIIESLGAEIDNKFQKIFDFEGMYPDERTDDVFKKIELEIFGRYVE